MTPNKTPTNKQAEAFITLAAGGYGDLIALPARLASEVLPYIVHLKREYAGNAYVLSVTGKEIEIKVIQPEAMAAAYVAGRLKGTPTT